MMSTKKRKKKLTPRRRLPSVEANDLRTEVWDRLERRIAAEKREGESRRSLASRLGVAERVLRRIEEGDPTKSRAGQPRKGVPNLGLHVLIDLCVGLGMRHLSRLFIDPAESGKPAKKRSKKKGAVASG